MKKAKRKGTTARQYPELSYCKASCEMQKFTGEVGEFITKGKPGDYHFGSISIGEASARTIHVILPNEGIAMLMLKPVSQEFQLELEKHGVKMAMWDWNGDEECPTLSPSIRRHPIPGEPGWHGYITNKRMENCE